MKNSELIRQGIVQCLNLEAECKALKESLSESQDHAQKLEAQIVEMTADYEGLMKILAEKDALIKRYSALMSETLDKTLYRERQGLRDDKAKLLMELEQDLDFVMSNVALEHPGSSDSERGQLQAKRPGLTRRGALVRRSQNGQVTIPRLLRQDAQTHESEKGEELTDSESLLEMAREVTIARPREISQ
ncbi:hypothetical protein FGADI_10492 [Fusarium gaditjirri]|uniref:Uncharacterized protein n=1 Tax=Fusarium gaditjirri TaxID=282569 RepID=A0A8H4WR77_9HYPO|nr:hypothetical protein FGADI_10492 [Fusarium gaditjirri]